MVGAVRRLDHLTCASPGSSCPSCLWYDETNGCRLAQNLGLALGRAPVVLAPMQTRFALAVG